MSGVQRRVLERDTARVLLVDELGRLLLLQGHDHTRPEEGTWWFTPGGGIDAGESPETAARRELAEETGIALDALGPVVFSRTTEFDFEDDRYRQREVFFLARTTNRPAVPNNWTAIERRSLLGARWWPLADLERANERVYPEGLVALVRNLLGADTAG
ncbi:MAG: NUDIX domain-containing protein [Actinomycetota bacterium]|jgi:8-oxo-dGTP pyrophosphatase MutT (NUDIX family)|nr:NUDIX domain-containing protein [Actinomycetota bacterium]